MFGKKNNNGYKDTKKSSYKESKNNDMWYDRKKDRSDGLSTYKAMVRDGLIDPNA